MALKPQLFFGKSCMHAYSQSVTVSHTVFIFILPSITNQNLPIAYNKYAALSFYDRDHGHCNGDNLEIWARDILAEYNIKDANGDITLICMPHVELDTSLIPSASGYVMIKRKRACNLMRSA